VLLILFRRFFLFSTADGPLFQEIAFSHDHAECSVGGSGQIIVRPGGAVVDYHLFSNIQLIPCQNFSGCCPNEKCLSVH